MLNLILRSIVQGRTRSALHALGLLAVTFGVISVAAASQGTVVQVDEDLSRSWRTTYDILVRPAKARSPIEERHRLVEANHLSGIVGGITFAQYESIKDIPGVEVAAPIAMLGYDIRYIPSGDMGRIPDPGAYRLQESLVMEDGVRRYDSQRRFLTYVGDDFPIPPQWDRNTPGLRISDSPTPIKSSFELPILIAAIDQSQEAALVGLPQTLTKGEYLKGDAPIKIDPIAPQIGPFGEPNPTYRIPILINTTPYVSLTLRAELDRLALPPDAVSFDAIMDKGGNNFLAALPSAQTLSQREMDGETAYRRLAEQLLKEADTYEVRVGSPFLGSMPSRIEYREVVPPFPHKGLVLEVVPAARPAMRVAWGGENWVAYRSSHSSELEAAFTFNTRGLFDIERLPKPDDVNRVPLETYFPPLATLRYDEAGEAVEPRTLRPTLNVAGYIQSPPMILTTLNAARTLAGEDSISAIRVRVGGVDQLTTAAQRKIKTIASEIVRRTDLTVDVMVGSSPRRVLVRVPEIGYVEEGWIQKGVSVSYGQGLQRGHWLLLVTLLGIGGIFALDVAWADVTARYRTIALQKALGWRSRTVFMQLLGQALIIGTIASALGALAAWGIAQSLKWQTPPAAMVIGVPMAVIGLCIAGSLYPVWLASRAPPIVMLQHGEVRSAGLSMGVGGGLGSYAWRNLLRRPSRTALTALAAALASALLVLLLGVTLARQGLLSGTLLGEFLLIRIERFHYALVGIGLALAALAAANTQLSGIVERRREIGLLKAVGWRTATVMRLFLLESVLLGALGGLIGTALGSLLFFSFYGSLPIFAAGIALLGIVVPSLVGVLAAIYPARVAASVPPAEVMRYE